MGAGASKTNKDTDAVPSFLGQSQTIVVQHPANSSDDPTAAVNTLPSVPRERSGSLPHLHCSAARREENPLELSNATNNSTASSLDSAAVDPADRAATAEAFRRAQTLRSTPLIEVIDSSAALSSAQEIRSPTSRWSPKGLAAPAAALYSLRSLDSMTVDARGREATAQEFLLQTTPLAKDIPAADSCRDGAVARLEAGSPFPPDDPKLENGDAIVVVSGLYTVTVAELKARMSMTKEDLAKPFDVLAGIHFSDEDEEP
jgi:hypothetical protein